MCHQSQRMRNVLLIALAFLRSANCSIMTNTDKCDVESLYGPPKPGGSEYARYIVTCRGKGLTEFPTFNQFGRYVIFIDVSNNPIKEIKLDSFKGLVELKYLEMNDLLLTSFPDELVNELKGLNVLSLGGNQFPCDCRTSWLWKDFAGVYEMLPRNLFGFHIRTPPSDVTDKYVKSIYPEMVCRTSSAETKRLLDIDLSQCWDKYAPFTTTTTTTITEKPTTKKPTTEKPTTTATTTTKSKELTVILPTIVEQVSTQMSLKDEVATGHFQLQITPILNAWYKLTSITSHNATFEPITKEWVLGTAIVIVVVLVLIMITILICYRQKSRKKIIAMFKKHPLGKNIEAGFSSDCQLNREYWIELARQSIQSKPVSANVSENNSREGHWATKQVNMLNNQNCTISEVSCIEKKTSSTSLISFVDDLKSNEDLPLVNESENLEQVPSNKPQSSNENGNKAQCGKDCHDSITKQENCIIDFNCHGERYWSNCPQEISSYVHNKHENIGAISTLQNSITEGDTTNHCKGVMYYHHDNSQSMIDPESSSVLLPEAFEHSTASVSEGRVREELDEDSVCTLLACSSSVDFDTNCDVSPGMYRIVTSKFNKVESKYLESPSSNGLKIDLAKPSLETNQSTTTTNVASQCYTSKAPPHNNAPQVLECLRSNQRKPPAIERVLSDDWLKSACRYVGSYPRISQSDSTSSHCSLLTEGSRNPDGHWLSMENQTDQSLSNANRASHNGAIANDDKTTHEANVVAFEHQNSNNHRLQVPKISLRISHLSEEVVDTQIKFPQKLARRHSNKCTPKGKSISKLSRLSSPFIFKLPSRIKSHSGNHVTYFHQAGKQFTEVHSTPGVVKHETTVKNEECSNYSEAKKQLKNTRWKICKPFTRFNRKKKGRQISENEDYIAGPSSTTAATSSN